MVKERQIISSQDLMRRLIAAGCPLDIERQMFDCSPAILKRLLICQDGGPTDSMAMELKCGATAFIIWLHIGSGLSWPINIWEWVLELEWENPGFWWLADSAEFGPPEAPYRFSTRDSPEFPWKDVINHRRRVSPGGAIDGVLLGFGLTRIPDAFVHGSTIHARLALVDQIGGKIWAPVDLWVDRSARLLHRSAPKRVRRPIFERPDVVSSKKGLVIA